MSNPKTEIQYKTAAGAIRVHLYDSVVPPDELMDWQITTGREIINIEITYLSRSLIVAAHYDTAADFMSAYQKIVDAIRRPKNA